MVGDEISFRAERVASEEEAYTPDFVVHAIHFAAGNPEEGGQHWHFSRAVGDEADDDGVCTVMEIQEVTIYDGIAGFSLSRDGVRCEFDEKAAKAAGVRRLCIDYSIDDATWESLQARARKVFEGEAYFAVSG